MDTQFVLAIWGALLSSILTVLRIIEFNRDRPHILVHFEEGRGVYSANQDYGKHSYVSITVANKGKRPISVDRAGLLLPRGSRFPFIDHVDYARPRTSAELTEGQAQWYHVKEDDIPNFRALRKSRKYVACVVDATGRKYYSHALPTRIWKLRRLGF
jgi:hypothetical protein